MGVAALICWLITALVGLYLLAVWLIENDAGSRGAAASRLPGPVLAAHLVLALAGLGVWVAYLLSDSELLAWTAVAILVCIAALGLTMLTRWIPVHRAFAEPAGGGNFGAFTAYDVPAEKNFPVSVVLTHGIFAAATFIVVIGAALGVGGS